MLYMLLFLAGLLILLFSVIITKMFFTRGSCIYAFPRRRLRISRKPLKLLKAISRIPGSSQELLAAQELARTLSENILIFREKCRTLPPLITSADHHIRIMALAQQIIRDNQIGESALINAIQNWNADPLSSGEAYSLPLCIASVQCNRLSAVLKNVLSDARLRYRAYSFAARLQASNTPAQLLKQASLSPFEQAELLSYLRKHNDNQRLIILEQHLESLGISLDDVTVRDSQRQLALTEELRRADSWFKTIATLDWYQLAEAADPVHTMLEKDPADVYKQLVPASRLLLRLHIEAFAVKARLEVTSVVDCALSLSQKAEPDSSEAHIGYWFQTLKGLMQLRSSLPGRWGWLYVLTRLQGASIRYGLLCILGFTAGFLFLQSHGPVFLLPFFSVTIGCLIRAFLPDTLFHVPLLALPENRTHIRTLIVLPATLTTPAEAIEMVRRLKVLRHTFPQDEADYLLCGDFAPCRTAVSASDQAIMTAACAAINALENPSFMYIQRQRAWSDQLHLYAARGSAVSAVTEICRLIVHGECMDTLACATTTLRHLERQYAYILMISPEYIPAPGMLSTMLAAIVHPLCGSDPAESSSRRAVILTPEEHRLFHGVGLMSPTAFLESTDGLLPLTNNACALCGELAGVRTIPGARVLSAPEAKTWDNEYKWNRNRWNAFMWQFPWVQTPKGFIRNPLAYLPRFRLRELLRESLVPIGQISLLLYSLLSARPLLFVLALLAPELRFLPQDWRETIARCAQLSLLPTRAAVAGRAIFDSIFHRNNRKIDWLVIEAWAQGICATIFAAIGVVLPAVSVYALSFGAIFAMFPLAHRFEDVSYPAGAPLASAELAFWRNIADRTWRYFSEQINESSPALPPCSIQFDPPCEPVDETSPQVAASCLLAIVCARDLGYVDANQAAQNCLHLCNLIAAWPMPNGLPCNKYSRDGRKILDHKVDAFSCGFLYAALLTAAQALRSCLAETAHDLLHVSTEAEHTAARLQLANLYDVQAGLFFAGFDEGGHPIGHLTSLSDSALLSLVACTRQQIPPEHFFNLHQAFVKLCGSSVPLSGYGNAMSLLAGLFFPVNQQDFITLVSVMRRHGQEKLWGLGECSYDCFDTSLRYRKQHFGIQEAALHPVSALPVYSAYAAALCSLYASHPATEALQQHQVHGGLTPLGFCDAIDTSHHPSVIGLYDTFHQGIILICAAHHLADAPIQRYFCALPEVEACLPLLNIPVRMPFLPAMAYKPAFQPPSIPSLRTLRRRVDPPDACLLGTADFRIISDAHGRVSIWDGDLSLVQEQTGMTVFLKANDSLCQVGSIFGDGEITVAPGEIRIDDKLDSIGIQLITLADTPRRRSLHIITLTNLTADDQEIELADYLLPDLNADGKSLAPSCHDPGTVEVRDCKSGISLYHTVSFSTAPLDTSVCNESCGLLNHKRDLGVPTFFAEPAASIVRANQEPCISFRSRMLLAGRSEIKVWFTTSLKDTPPPTLLELDGIRRLAALHHQAKTETLPLWGMVGPSARTLTGLLLRWHLPVCLHLERNGMNQTLQELLVIAHWFRLHGFQYRFVISCPEQMHNTVRQHIQAFLITEEGIEMVLPEGSEQIPKSIQLHNQTPLSDQLEAMQHPLIPLSLPPMPKAPESFPSMALDLAGPYGGFDTQTSDYVIQLQAGEALPSAWTNMHSSNGYREVTSDNGFLAPFHEQIWLHLADGQVFTPFSPCLPRTIHMGAGTTIWEAWTGELDCRLCSACMPAHPCGFRSLRIRNVSKNVLSMSVFVMIPMADQPGLLQPSDHAIYASTKESTLFAAGHGWNLHIAHMPERFHPAMFEWHECADGNAALLECSLMIQPQTSHTVLWITGVGQTGDIDDALAVMRDKGVSTLLRSVRAEWSRRLSRFIFNLPEKSASLLLNRILPVQAMHADKLSAILALIYLMPDAARQWLLDAAAGADSPSGWLRISLLLSCYIDSTGDSDILHVCIHGTDSVLQCCTDAVAASASQNTNDCSLDETLLFLLAAKQLNQIVSSSMLEDCISRFTASVQARLAHIENHSESLDIRIVSLLVLALGVTPKNMELLTTAWNTLYDRPHDLIRSQTAADSVIVPGYPGNGGMFTHDAILCMLALLKTGNIEDAFELLRALNPIYHTDELERVKIFRGAPYQLHGGLCDLPMEAGRAISEGGDEAAVILYYVILRHILGIRYIDNQLSVAPRLTIEWDEFSFTLQEGSSTWHFSIDRRIPVISVDGQETKDYPIHIHDDGKIHQVRIPMERPV